MLRIFVSRLYVESLHLGWISIGWQVLPSTDKRVIKLDNPFLPDLIRDIISRYEYQRNLEIINNENGCKLITKRHGKFHSLKFPEIASEFNDTRIISSILFDDDRVERF